MWNRLVPIAHHADDQKNARLVLEGHVAHRFIMAFSTIATVGSLGSRPFVKLPKRGLAPTVLRANAIAVVAGSAVGVLVTEMKMRSEPEIGWQDRAWRLLQNPGQLELDDTTVTTGVLGGVFGLLYNSGKGKAGPIPRVVGGMGLGTFVGLGLFAASKALTVKPNAN
ncbi:hypothetical protein HK101_003753 [Irineochytrium annulatum]|nr:hypothetical protein HK101_003753 [Irineochytrium annulatum]